MDLAEDRALRERIMHRLAARTASAGGFLTREELSHFEVGDGTRRRLIDTSKGIWNPRDLAASLSIVSSPDGPYEDRFVDGAYLRYDYRAGSTAGDNTKLRRAGDLGLPLILLNKIPGGYAPVFPVYVVEDDKARRQFKVAVDESLRFLGHGSALSEVERRYAQTITRHRLHQAVFRGMVVHAYDVRCTVCELKHGELLDAAHITPDSDAEGRAVVTNGLSLCKIHHAAYDNNLLGISPDYRVQINRALLRETDGPMLKHGLQEMHGRALALPRRPADRPDRDRLATRFEVFAAS